jgi:hypothetical protein
MFMRARRATTAFVMDTFDFLALLQSEARGIAAGGAGSRFMGG